MLQHKLFLLILLVLSSNFAYAQTEAPAPPPSPQQKTRVARVNFYKPEIGITERKGMSHVILTGRARPNTKVRLASDEIALINSKGQIKTVKSNLLTKAPEAIADERGVFSLEMDLPFVTAQLPVEAELPTGEKKIYQLSLVVTKEDIEIANQKNIRNSPYARRTWSIWGGLGYNYLKYNQTVPAIPANVGLQSFDVPTYFAKVERNLTQEWALQGTFNQAPGKANSSAAIKVKNGNYNWTYFAADVSYLPRDWKRTIHGLNNEFGILLGAQYHMTPFIDRSSTTVASEANIDTNMIIMMTVGGEWIAHLGRYWIFETFMRYQQPMATGPLFDIASKLCFDGSLGIIHKWNEDWRYGIFWYGQEQSYNFSNHTDKYFQANPPAGGSAKVSGSQDLFFSNVEFRIGVEFD